MSKWLLRRNKADIQRMSRELNITEIFACVLANRHIYTREAAKLYIKPSLKKMYNPFEMKDMQKAVMFISDSVKAKRNIIIYGDYDVDGVMSTVILYKTLKSLGAVVDYYIPDRRKEGYGLSKATVFKLKELGCDIVFCCDNGIASLEEAEYIKELGMQLVILDHHEPRFTENGALKTDILPLAEAILDNKRNDCTYPFKALCAGAMAYKFSKAIYEYLKIKFENEAEAFVLASLATVCDIVDLVDENRIFVKTGLKLLNSRDNINIGLNELLKCRGLERGKISETSIGFVIGPCINAAGRLENALAAVRLFLEENKEKAFEFADELSRLNEERKSLTIEAFERIKEYIESSELKNDNVLVVYDKIIDESIVGIVAGKIKELYYKPTIIITDGEDFAKGSARSIEGYNIFEELFLCIDLFEKFGGHYMAAGLSIKHENIDILRKRLNKGCKLTEADMMETIRVDKVLRFSEISLYLAEEMEIMKPFGNGNEEAIFATKNVFVERISFVGANKNIIQFIFVNDEGCSLKGISFNGYEKFVKFVSEDYNKDIQDEILKGNLKNADIRFDIVYSLSVNEYNNTRSVQLKIKDFRKAL